MRKLLSICRQHFRRLTLLNLLFFALTLPLLFVLYICVNAVFGISAGDVVADVLPGLGFYMTLFSGWSRGALLLSIAVSALLYGPAKFLFFVFLRQFYYGEFHFVTDAFLQLRRRLLPALILGVADLFILGQALTNLTGVQTWIAPLNAGGLVTILRVCSAAALLFWLQVRRFLFILAACSDLGIWAILKDSVILAFTGFGVCSRSMVISILIWAVTYLTLPIVTAVLLPVASLQLNNLGQFCYLYPEVQRRILKE